MKCVLLFLPFMLICGEPQDIQFHHTHDVVTISIHDNRGQLAFPDIVAPAEQITINMPTDHEVDPTPSTPTMSSPEWTTLTRNQRVRQLCVNNKTAVIAGVATVTSATIAGIVALIVHFTAA
jgi:hypothetical protein